MSQSFPTDTDLFDVVDAEDRVIKQATRAEVHARGWFHRAVHILVFNSQQQLLLQKRSMTKDTSPGKWTTSCSGHVDSGENYLTACIRELKEELNIYIRDAESLQFICKHPPCDQTSNEFIEIYQLQWDGEPAAPEEEVAELRWLNAESLNKWLADSPTSFAKSFKLVWQLANA